MALLTPELVPVKMYKWDDVGAPELKKTTNSLMSLFEACLVTGYGTKTGAGWTKPYEASGIKVFRPQVGAEIDFYLQCSANTTTQMNAKVYLNMTDASTGDLKLQCAQPFKFARGTVSNPIRWVLVASTRGFWFFNEQVFIDFYDNRIPFDNSGAWFFVGDTARNTVGERAVFLQHTGGTHNAGYYVSMLGYDKTGESKKDSQEFVAGKLLDSAGAVHTTNIESFFNATIAKTNVRNLSALAVFTPDTLYQLPAVFAVSDGFKDVNYTKTTVAVSGYTSDAIVVSTSPLRSENFCVAIEFWSY